MAVFLVKTTSTVLNLFHAIRDQGPSYGHPTFDQALKICKLCHDADLISPQDVFELGDSAMPAWVNVTAQATLTDNQATNVTWTPNIVENLIWPTQININGTFGVLVQPRKGFRNHTFVAMPLNIRFLYGVYPPGANLRVNGLICKAAKKSGTHQWSFVDETCIYLPTFGCHTYENHLHRSENPNGTFVTNLIREAIL
uniref:Uncharacterized protein n=1 Tax=Romanomermis culicivorax TaxID=13658 RepID=A0A915KNS8_ROMCU